jgi:protein-S-isoprenylcysteine O-methyltransferase Ste14
MRARAHNRGAIRAAGPAFALDGTGRVFLTSASDRRSTSSWLRRLPQLGPPQWLLVALLAVVLLHLLLPPVRLVPRGCFWGCLALAVLGFLIAQLAALQMLRAGTPHDYGVSPSALLTHGLFGRSRNPMYVGMLLLLAGEAAMLGTLGALLPLPAFFLGVRFGFVRREEGLLRHAFGQNYLDYERRVRRWL